MTVPNQTPQNVHTANGATTTFAYQFKILDTDHLDVYLDDVLQTSGYTVTGEGVNTGGTVVFTTAPAADTEVILMRSMTIERTAYDYQSAGDFLAETVNEDFDAAIMIAQQINNTVEQRALLFPKTLDRSSNTNALPEPEEGRVLYWASGEIQNALISSLATNPTFASELRTFDTMAQAIADATLEESNVLLVGDRANSYWDLSSSGTANGYDVVELTASGLYATLRLDNGNTSFRALGAVGDGATSNNSLFSRIDVLLSDGATIYGHPDDDYLISGFRTFTKSITIDMQGGTISSAALSNSAIVFYANGIIMNATMDNVWVGWDGTGCDYGKSYNCDYINQTYSNTTAINGAKGIVIDFNRFSSYAAGPSGSSSYPCFQVTTGAGFCKFTNNWCVGVTAGVTWDGISAYSNECVVSGNHFDTMTYYALKTDVGNYFVFRDNYIANSTYGVFYEGLNTSGGYTAGTSGNQVVIDANTFVNVDQCVRSVAATNQYIRGVFSNNYMSGCDYGIIRSVGHWLMTGNHFYNGGMLYYYGGGSTCSWDLTIENNVIYTTVDTSSYSLGNDSDSYPIAGAIVIGSLTDSTYKSTITIRNNTFHDYHTNAIMVASIGAYYPRVTVTDNKFEAGANSVNHIVIGASRDLVVTRNREIAAPTRDELRYIRLDRNVGFPQVYENDWQYTTASPTTDTHLLGTKYTHSAPASAGYIGFVCVFAFGTTLSAGEPSGETSMAVTAGTGTANGDIVGVVQDDGTIHWTTVSSGGGTTTIVLTSGLTDDAASGNRVYFHRWKGYGLIA